MNKENSVAMKREAYMPTPYKRFDKITCQRCRQVFEPMSELLFDKFSKLPTKAGTDEMERFRTLPAEIKLMSAVLIEKRLFPYDKEESSSRSTLTLIDPWISSERAWELFVGCGGRYATRSTLGNALDPAITQSYLQSNSPNTGRSTTFLSVAGCSSSPISLQASRLSRPHFHFVSFVSYGLSRLQPWEMLVS